MEIFYNNLPFSPRKKTLFPIARKSKPIKYVLIGLISDAHDNLKMIEKTLKGLTTKM